MAAPLVKIVSEGGGSWGLSDDAYIRWWRQNLTEDDRATFAALGADEMLGRFVCAYDFITIDQGENPSSLVKAWALATGRNEFEHETRVTAQRAWEHPAVREILDRLLSRDTARAARRIERNTAALIEDTIDQAMTDGSIDQRTKAILVAARFLTHVAVDKQSARQIRAKLENDALKQAITKAREEQPVKKDVSPEEAVDYVKVLIGILGADRVRALLPAPPIDA